MGRAGIEKSSSTFHRDGSYVGALLVWLVAQMLMLLVPVSRIKLADEFVRPAESLALAEMMAGQMVVLALMFPFLLRSAGASVAIAASGWPFLLLAGVLASTPGQQVGWCAAYLTLWVAVLAMWRSVLRTRALQMVGVAIPSALVLGMPLLEYLHEEFSGGAETPTGAFIGRWNPHAGWLSILEGDEARAGTWGLAIALLMAAIAIRVGAVLWRRGRHRGSGRAASAAL